MKLKHSLKSYYKGFAFLGDDFSNDDEIFVLKGVNFNTDLSINFDNIQYLPNEFYEDKKYEKFKVKKDDIIISLVGSIGKMTLIDQYLSQKKGVKREG
jgi:type I restriction enzyme S subunit